jgi:hypothetical protein
LRGNASEYINRLRARYRRDVRHATQAVRAENTRTGGAAREGADQQSQFDGAEEARVPYLDHGQFSQAFRGCELTYETGRQNRPHPANFFQRASEAA